MATRLDDEVSGQPESEAHAETSRRKFFGSKNFKIAALLVLVMAVEAAAIYLLLPQPTVPGTGNEPADRQTAESRTGSRVDTVEVPIDTFNCTNSIAAPGSVIHVTFNLVAVVARNQELPFDTAANSLHKARVRQAIVKVARSASLDELSDPDLGIMKRLIREEVNKVLHKSYVIEVVISDFKTLEQ